MGKRFSMIVLAALLFLFESVPVFAQSDLSAGYQFVRLSTADGASNLPQGFGIDYARSISNGWRIVGVFGWAARHENGPLDTFSADLNFNQITIAGGIRRQFGGETKTYPYVQAVVGLARSALHATLDGLPIIDDTSIDPMFEPGAGIASRLTDSIGFFGQIDYRLILAGSSSEALADETVQGFRIFVGARVAIP